MVASVAVAACQEASLPEPLESDEAAVELWSHPDSVGIEIYSPADLKAASRDVAWGVDRIAGAIMRFEPRAGEFGVFGFLDNDPPEVIAPMRLAVAEASGILAFDDSTGMVDTYTPGGQHVRGFDPGIRPSILEVSRSPLGLTLGTTVPDANSVPRLIVVRMDFLGRNRDTLLAPGVGPETVQGLTARGGTMMVSPSESGLWLFSKEVSDTVFEISSSGGRKMILPEPDTTRLGVIADLDEQLLWVVTVRPEGGLDYEAYDVTSTEPGEIFEGEPRYLGARTTPAGFVGKVATSGAVIGWWTVRHPKVVPQAYDMRIPELREGADAARALRQSRRQELARQWIAVREAVARALSEQAGEAVPDTAE